MPSGTTIESSLKGSDGAGISGITAPGEFQVRSIKVSDSLTCRVVSPDLNQYGWSRFLPGLPSIVPALKSLSSSSSSSSSHIPSRTELPSASPPSQLAASGEHDSHRNGNDRSKSYREGEEQDDERLTISTDINFMDLAYRLARNSYCIEGNMGCVFVRNIPQGRGGDNTPLDPPAQIVCQSVNTACLESFHSDSHAEANGVAACAAHGVSLSGTSCYVTRAPCSECFKLLCMARVSRIVCPQGPSSERCAEKVDALGIEWVCLQDNKAAAQARDKECAAFEDWERVAALRKERKKQRSLQRERKKKEKAERQAIADAKRKAKSSAIRNIDANACNAELQRTESRSGNKRARTQGN